ncbi:helix-turn-helix domain-containing protein [Paenibacillus sp. TRM 82003]|nr:helix-turn-helix domain-containing protein [Paenibacillus sp. TRM 82003]
MSILQHSLDGSYESLEAMADAISEALGRQVTIEDAEHRLLAYSTHELATDPVRLATIAGRRVPGSVIQSLWISGAMQRLQESDEPVRIPANAELGFGGRAAVAIRKKDKVLGYIWVLEGEQALDGGAMEQLAGAAQAVKAKLLLQQTRSKKLADAIQEFVWQMLTGQFQSDAWIRTRAAMLQVTLPDRCRVLAFELEEAVTARGTQLLQHWIDRLQIAKIAGFAADRNQLVLLVGCNEIDERAELVRCVDSIAERLPSQCGMTVRRTGIGRGVNDYTNVENSYQDALTLLELKKHFPETDLFLSIEEAGYYRYLPSIQRTKQLEQIENPHIAKLMQYDRANQGELLKTLEVYLSCDSSVRDAAAALHIHMNTLSYRLTRITEVCGIDLRCMDQKVSLYLDLKARER